MKTVAAEGMGFCNGDDEAQGLRDSPQLYTAGRDEALLPLRDAHSAADLLSGPHLDKHGGVLVTCVQQLLQRPLLSVSATLMKHADNKSL